MISAKDTEANERCFHFSFLCFLAYTSGCHIQISLALLLGPGKSLILYRWVGQIVWVDWAHSVSGSLSFQSSSILWKPPPNCHRGRGVPIPFVSALILNQDSLQSKYSGVSSNQNSSYPSPYSKAVGLFLLLFSFILKWKHCFYLKPYENWKCCLLFFLVEMKYFIIMGKRKYSHF